MVIRLKPKSPGPLWRFFSSVWLAVGLMSWVGVVCVLGTFSGLKEAEVIFFRASWVAFMIATLMVNIFIATLNRASKPLYTPEQGFQFPYRLSQIPFLFVHLGLLLTFGAKIITSLFLVDATLSLSEAPTNNPGMPAHRSNILTLKERQIEYLLLPSADDLRGPLDIAEAQRVGVKLKSGEQALGRITKQSGAGDQTRYLLTAFDGTVKDFRREEVSAMRLEGIRPVHLTALPAREELNVASSGALGVGILTSLVFVALAFWAGSYFGQGLTPIITPFVIVCLAGCLYAELPSYKEELLGGAYTLTYKKYYPHSRRASSLHDDAETSNPALHVRFGDEDQAIFYYPQSDEARFNGMETLHSPLEFGPVQVTYARASVPRSEREAYVAAARQPNPEGTITFRLGAASVTVSDAEELEGRELTVGDATVTILGVYGNLTFRENPQAGPGQPSMIPVDAGGLEKPAVQYKIAGEESPRLYGAWLGDLNKVLSERLPPTELVVEYRKPAPLLSVNGRASEGALVFLRYEDGSFDLVTFEKDGPPTFQALGDGRVVDIDVAGLTHEVELLGAYERAHIHEDIVNVTKDDFTNFEDYPDAVFVEVSDGEASASGWLQHLRPLILNVGGTPIRLDYTNRTDTLPFKVQLDKFDIETHPGTSQPSEFRSTVTVFAEDSERKTQFEAEVFMNNTLDYAGYRLFQSSYSLVPGQPKISIFSVARDPGTPVFYAGCIVLCFGVMLIFYVKPSLQKIEKRRARVAAGLPAVGPLPKADAKGKVVHNKDDGAAVAAASTEGSKGES